MQTTDLKTINYRGGIVQFRIPANWVEEYGEDNGGTFYDATHDGGTLRVNLLTFKAPADKPVLRDSASEVLTSDAEKYATEVVELSDNVAMIQYDQPSQEQGKNLIIRFWRIAQVLLPKHVRIAIFSYTLLDTQLTDPVYAAELALLDREIRAAQFSGEIGVTALPKKSWWRPW